MLPGTTQGRILPAEGVKRRLRTSAKLKAELDHLLAEGGSNYDATGSVSVFFPVIKVSPVWRVHAGVGRTKRANSLTSIWPIAIPKTLLMHRHSAVTQVNYTRRSRHDELGVSPLAKVPNSDTVRDADSVQGLRTYHWWRQQPWRCGQR
eukprot:3833411-Pyramimonas_sp.AAC.1